MNEAEATKLAEKIASRCKPCPFCGSVPMVEVWSEFTRSVDYYTGEAEEVVCYSIDCCIAGTRCVETWNHRV